MNRDRLKKFITLVIVFIAIVGLAIGFAAFSNSISVKTNANVQPNSETFKVGLSTSNSGLVAGTVTPTRTLSLNSSSNLLQVTASNAIIENTNNTSSIRNLSVKFTESGQSVTYRFYIYNAGYYVAYLNSVVFNNVPGKSSNKYCYPVTGATDVSSICNDILVSLQIGNDTFTSTNRSLTSHSLNKSSAEEVILTISYNASQDLNTDFYVNYGDITLTYTTQDN